MPFTRIWFRICNWFVLQLSWIMHLLQLREKQIDHHNYISVEVQIAVRTEEKKLVTRSYVYLLN